MAMVFNTVYGGGGFNPQIVVTSDTGSTITCTKGSTVLTATEVSGTWTFDIPEYGTWTINGINGSLTAATTVAVTAVIQYAVKLNFINVYGVSKTYTDSGTTWTRIDDAEGLTATAGIGTSGYSSDFDNCYPWSQMKRETLSTGDVMVKIPKFWYKRTRSGSTETIEIADAEKTGFSIHPLFKPSTTVLDYVYIGAYETSSGHASKTGVAPLVNLTRDQFRSNAANKGSGWSQFDICALSAIQMLYTVEFASNDSQGTVGRGYCDSHSSAISTGNCDSLYTNGVYSGRPTGTDGSTAVMYRGIENPWCNIWKWVDGLNWNGGTYYVCTNPSNYADNTTTNYTQLSYTGGSTSYSENYISQEGLDTNNSWCIMPTAASGSASTFMCDGIWSSTGWRVCISGGSWDSCSLDGLFAVHVSADSSYFSTTIGGRLLYRPV